MRITVRVDGNERQVIAAIKNATSNKGMVEYFHKYAIPWLNLRAASRFANEGDSASGKWAPLSPVTIRIRKEKGFGAGPINVRTGQLKDWVLNGAPQIDMAGFPTLRYPGPVPGGKLGDKIETAQVGGGSTGSAPPRPVVAINEDDAIFLANKLKDHVEDAGLSVGRRRGGLGPQFRGIF